MPYLTVNGKRLHYADTKPDPDSHSHSHSHPATPETAAGTETTKGPLTLIFVHGLGSTQNYFGPILPYLRAYRCVRFDNYGAGRSMLDSEGGGEGGGGEGMVTEHSVEGIAGDVKGVLDGLSVGGRVVVVGYSMGGIVPTLMASLQGGEGDGNGNGIGHGERERDGEREREGKKWEMVGGVCIGPVHPGGEAVKEVFRKRVGAVREGGMEAMADTIPTAATGSKATALHRAFIREMLMAQEVEGYVANCRAIEHAKPPSYKDVKVPILIVAGEEDKSAPLKGCEFILGELGSKSKKLEVLKGVGHWHCVEAGDEVGPLVKTFCEGLM